MMWLNTLIASLWNIIDSDFYNSGLGLYMSEVYEEFFSSLLNSIHETTSGFINDMKLKKFHFGINPPIIQHIETSIIRDHQCIEKLLHQSMEQHAQQKRRRRGRGMGGGLGEGMSERQQKGRSRHKDIIQRYLKALHLNTSSLLTEEQEEFLVNLSEQVSDFILDNLLKAHASFQDDGSFDPSSDSSSSEENRTDSNTSSTTSSFSRRNKDSAMKLNHFFVACDTLIMDVDMIYVSKDMNIILSLRTNEIKSMLPEFTIHLSELIFQGKIRFKLELANDYPFIGHNTTMSFIQLPILDFTINSFGGLDLSSIPYAFQFVNSSLYSILQEYTEPKSTAIDLRHTLCSTCDQVEGKTYSLQEMWMESMKSFDYFFQNFWKILSEQTMNTMKKMKIFLTRQFDRFRQKRSQRDELPH